VAADHGLGRQAAGQVPARYEEDAILAVHFRSVQRLPWNAGPATPFRAKDSYHRAITAQR
jgi:hypothetical protein